MLQNIVLIAIAVAGVAFITVLITTAQESLTAARRSTGDMIDRIDSLRRDNDRIVDILTAHGDKKAENKK